VNRKCRAGLVLCCGAALFLFSETRAALHAEHTYCGEDCPVCSLMQGMTHGFRQVRYAPVFPVVPPGVFTGAALAAWVSVVCGIPVSSVRLKVKMNR
jgi:hypothetical protein